MIHTNLSCLFVVFFLQLDGWSIFELGFLWKLSLLLSAVYLSDWMHRYRYRNGNLFNTELITLALL